MRRTLLLYAVPALLLASGWLRVEEGNAPRGEFALVALLALAPALAPSWRARVAAAAVAALVSLRVAFDVSPLEARPFDARHDFFGPLVSRFADGFLEFYDVTVPFAPEQHARMHGVVLVAVFGFSLAVALAIAARRPLLAVAALVTGAAWPATLVSGGGLGRGALILAAVLTLLAAGGARPVRSYRPALLAGAVLVAAALAAGASPAVAKGEFLAWKQWDFYDRPQDPVSVRFVWDANYGGIQFPTKETTVMTVDGVDRAFYWRATTLDTYDDGRWYENLALIGSTSDVADLTSDPYLPAAARDRRRWRRADVTIRALADERLPGPTMPVALDPRGLGEVDFHPGGVATVDRVLDREARYSVYFYAPRPTPAQLAAVRPTALRRRTLEAAYLEVAPGAAVLPFGAPGREQEVQALLERGWLGASLLRYRSLYETAKAVVRRPKSQYAAVVALEDWFRRTGGFTYEERPIVSWGVPPLVEFLRRKEGYCQHFAGAMALMLRYLGIPARVAAGFTSGAYDRSKERWTVTDHDAHAWVEVWFDGWGWLPFDPTPGRGQLGGTYTTASPRFDTQGAREVFEAAGIPFRGPGVDTERTLVEGGRDLPGDLAAAARAGDRGASLLRLLVLVAAALVLAIALAKTVRRRARYLSRDPRRLAAACRAELVDFLLDQGVDVPRSATLEELGGLVERTLRVDAVSFVRAASAARFAPPRDARSAARAARTELRRLQRRLRARLGRIERARGLLSMRSLGLTG